MSMSPGDRLEQNHQARLELSNLRMSGGGGNLSEGCGFCGCIVLVVLLVLLLCTGLLMGYGWYERKHNHISGLPAAAVMTPPAR